MPGSYPDWLRIPLGSMQIQKTFFNIVCFVVDIWCTRVLSTHFNESFNSRQANMHWMKKSLSALTEKQYKSWIVSATCKFRWQQSLGESTLTFYVHGENICIVDNDDSINTTETNVFITTEQIEKWLKENLPIMVFELIESSRCEENATHGVIVAPDIHHSRAHNIHKIIIVTSLLW